MRSRWIISVALALSAVPAAVAGHGVGDSFELQTESFFVDIGFDRPFQVGEETLIDFSLFSVKKGKVDDLASFTQLTYNIHSGSSILATRTITKPEFGKVFETVTPKQRGNWKLSVDFVSNDASIFTTSFDMEILPSAKAQKKAPSNTAIFIAIIAGIAGCSYFIFQRSSSL